MQNSKTPLYLKWQALGENNAIAYHKGNEYLAKSLNDEGEVIRIIANSIEVTDCLPF